MRKKRFLMTATALFCTLSLFGCNAPEINRNIGEVLATAAVSSTETEAVTETAVTSTAVTTVPRPERIINYPEDNREYRVDVKNSETVTLMIYICGSDLESYMGAASADIEEMVAASNDNENLNIIIETGGANRWKNKDIESDTNQIFRIHKGKMELLRDVGEMDMTDGDTVYDFISYASENYPADRNMLIMWDHGGGTVGGLMNDERFDSYESMSVIEFGEAIEKSGVIFDVIGFDCCLMGTVETAFMVEKYADFMIASQRNEPVSGWSYTGLITALNEDPSIPTEDLGYIIVNDYFENTPKNYKRDGEMTLAMIDLSYIPVFFNELDSFLKNADESLLSEGAFIAVSQTMAASKTINEYSQADMLMIIDALGGSDAVAKRLSDAIVYSDSLDSEYNGLSLFFPYDDLSVVSDALDIYDEIGISNIYGDFIKTAANLMAGGQIHSNGGDRTYFEWGGITYYFDWAEYYSDFSWYDSSFSSLYSDFYDDTAFDSSTLELTDHGDYYTLPLTEKQRGLVTDYLLCVYYDDGEGYIDLGSDADYEFDSDGNLIVDFDYRWVSVNGKQVCYYSIENKEYANGDFYSYGYVPCTINNNEAEIIIMRDNESPEGYAAGWRFAASGDTSMKGLFDIEDGMRIQFYCDYYSYDYEFEESFPFGSSIRVDGELEVGYKQFNADTNAGKFTVFYEIHDIFQNIYNTESVVF
jgi:hypothetical protein